MSLAKVSGKVSSITKGSAIANYTSTKLFGNSSFLRNHERAVDTVTSAISAIQSIVTDLSGAAGYRSGMYVIGRIDNEATRYDNETWTGNFLNNLAAKTSSAISYWTGEGTDSFQNGVIIDGFDNFRGDISVALPDNPVMYRTSVSDQVVRNPNRVSMRVYVDLVHTDDIVQNVMQSVANSFGGLPGTIMNAVANNNMNRVQKALNGLQWIQEYGRPFKVYTPHKVYDNMMIERIAPINDQKMNEILAADITFKEIIPTQSLGVKEKTSARIAPSTKVMDRAYLAGWL